MQNNFPNNSFQNPPNQVIYNPVYNQNPIKKPFKKPNIWLVISILLLLISSGLGGLSYYFYTQKVEAENKTISVQNEIIRRANEQIIAQKKQKNEIADIFDNQAALNDDLIDQQRMVVTTSEEYLRLIEKSVRFVEGQPQFFPNVEEAEFLKQKNDVVQKIADLNRISAENAANKTRNSDRINQIYLDAKEDRNNTANEREGFR